MSEDTSFDYISDMKEYYRSDDAAKKYQADFSDRGSWRHRIIANRERSVVRTLLRRVPHGEVLDIPTGTGKLAPVFAESGSDVVACDISESMLQTAKSEYHHLGPSNVQFQICDAEKISETLERGFDIAVCLRLLHRVPSDIKRKILRELGAVAGHVIVSTAVKSQYHKVRRWIRRRLLSGDPRGNCYETPAVTKSIFTDGFDVITWKRVLPLFSQERVYLLRSDD